MYVPHVLGLFTELGKMVTAAEVLGVAALGAVIIWVAVHEFSRRRFGAVFVTLIVGGILMYLVVNLAFLQSVGGGAVNGT